MNSPVTSPDFQRSPRSKRPSGRDRNVASLFQLLLESNIPYVVFDGWKGLPHGFQENRPVGFLTMNSDTFLHLVGARRLRAGLYEATLGSETQSVERFRFRVVRKGEGFLPERFESTILANRVLYNRTVYIPDPSALALLSLYRAFFRDHKVTEEMQQCIREFLESRVGPKPVSRKSFAFE